MMHIDLISYYERIFALKHIHKWNIEEAMEMIPWELDIMLNFISSYIETEAMHRKQAAQNRMV